ncbi:Energy-coupling factor transporter ATP-binding protein EcfA1 [Candidatus Izimaplasma bacterium HR1]|uniref:energy-coupling factor transporter ATPase n=1 Tax=Candidatus Izimoplasma sp. HR1 TaxID=1541959 RepID=UPI0004F91746|nr:Energy-coupling factor transporter ATP-binding protein EcfA1 [Candidatus Izimaplasma bacterium HR1]
MNIIEIKDLSFSYLENNPVLTDVSLTIKKGDWVSVLGHNGSGKSTLSKLIIGLLKADKGDIVVDGITLTEETVHDVRKKIGIVFQNPDNQFVGVTVEDDIAFGMENLCFDREEMLKRIEEYSKKVSMQDYLKKEPHNLSGGQKQRVAIAGILAMNTDIIIFDEATSMLDPKGRDKIMDTIKEINDSGVTVISITHDMKEAVHSDKIIILKEGTVIASGDTKEILNDKTTLNSSNLELLLPLKLLHKLQEANIDNKELNDILWQLSLNK